MRSVTPGCCATVSAISIGVLVVLWIGVWALLRAGPGLTFMQAQANLGVINPTAYGKITSLSSVAGGLGYGMVLSSDPITKILFATAVPLAEIAVNLAFLTVTTRVLFAQAFDRLCRWAWPRSRIATTHRTSPSASCS